MKFTVVVVVLALAMGANSSVLPLGPWGHSVVVGHAGHHLLHAPGSVAIQASAVPAVIGHHGHILAGPGPVQIVSGPHVVAAPHVVATDAHAHVVAPHVVAAHAPHVVPGGTFVAKTRGAVHVAPLAGHIQSVVSANLEPAPGTH